LTIETYLTDLSTFLQTNGVSGISIAGYHDSSGNAVFITPYGGKEYDKIVSGEINPYMIDVQVITRNSSNETAYALSISIYKLLRNISNRIIGTTEFKSIKAKASPAFIMKTNSGYYQYSVNFSMLIQ